MSRPDLGDSLFLVGAVVLLLGVGLWSIPAAVALAGALVIALALLGVGR